ncbi:chitin-binding type-4 domain-containing protein [Nephila pilipes]|uniref:Chitin-binding type-4 domain-containing protein n=1 Tax=Nephila pilipes TaxID=299642 RepID=A0A8X6QAH7_NEPPI|nr:chitin-binding type-4 domain-containing protein [Nephila pilipes]
MHKAVWALCYIWLQLPIVVWGHARLMLPPSRSSMWRLGFPTKKNFNDNALYCGGIQIQWQRNGGKCGICGDPYNMPHPRDNEAKGKYGQGIISRRYLSGQILEAVVDVTTNHRGYFEFKLCPNNNPKKEASQECLDKYPLKLAYGEGSKNLTLLFMLSCKICKNYSSNNWGRCEDGVSRLGCGPQETFRGCADIAIGNNNNIFPYTPNQNDIGNKFYPYSSSLYKSTKQKYSKDTSITKYPKYALEASRQSERNKSSFITRNKHIKIKSLSHSASWMKLHFEKKTTTPSTLPNGTNHKPLLEWKSQQVPGYILQDSHSSSTLNTPTFSSDTVYFTEIPNVETSSKESQLSKMLHQQQKEIHLLRFYLQNPRVSSNRNVTRGFTLGGRIYRDFWALYASMFSSELLSTFSSFWKPMMKLLLIPPIVISYCDACLFGKGVGFFIHGSQVSKTDSSMEIKIRAPAAILKLFVILCFVKSIWGHARLMEPPSRSSMWRHGYHTPKNYDDDGLYCGGMHTQWKINGGKCGVCGDPWHLEIPRPNENGGKYGNGIIVRTYKPGQIIPVVVDITANHKGFFEFRVCANKNRKKEVTQECLDQNLLTILNGTSTKYNVESHGSSRVSLNAQLPKGFTCKYCVFQWTYTAGNNWGKCKDGTFGLGCGAQETFKACADISISERNLFTEPSTVNQVTIVAKPITTFKPTKTNQWTTTAKPWTVSNSTKVNRWTTIAKPWTVPKPTKINRSTTAASNKPTSTIAPSVNKDRNKKKKLPTSRPSNFKGQTFQEALDRIKKDPRLRWMLEVN